MRNHKMLGTPTRTRVLNVREQDVEDSVGRLQSVSNTKLIFDDFCYKVSRTLQGLSLGLKMEEEMVCSRRGQDASQESRI